MKRIKNKASLRGAKRRSNPLSRLWLFLGALFTQLLFSSSAFAAIFTPPSTDISIGYLGKLFGGVGDILQGPSKTVLGVIFNSFNAGVMTIGGLLLSYTTLRAIVDTAHDGEPMGKKLSQWVIMRTAIGVGILVPNAVSGYSMLQVTMIWIVVQGVGLADIIWNQTLDFLNKGGVIYEGSAAGTGKIPSLENVLAIGGKKYGADAYDPDLDRYAGSLSFMRAQACMIALQDDLEARRKFVQRDMELHKDQYGQGTKKYKAAKDFVNASINLRWQIDTPDPQTQQQVISFPGNIPKADFLASLNGACGRFRWTWDNPKSGEAGNDLEYWRAKEEGMRGMLGKGETAARDAIRYVRDKGAIDAKASINTAVINAMVDAAAQYQDRLSSIRIAKANEYKARTGAQDRFTQFYNDAKARGWATAGGYYYDLVKVQRQSFDTSYFQIWSSDEVGVVPGGAAIPKYPLKAAPRFASAVEPETGTLKGIRDTLTNIFDTNELPTNANEDVFKKELWPVLRWNNQVLHSAVGAQIEVFNAAQMNSVGIPGLTLPLLGVAQSSLVKPIGGTANIADLPAGTPGFLNTAYKAAATPTLQLLKGSLLTNIILTPLNKSINQVVTDWKTIMLYSMTPLSSGVAIYIGSPIEKLYYLGQSMMDAAISCWETVISTMYTIGIAFQAANIALTAVVGGLAFGTFWGTTSGAIEAVKTLITAGIDFSYKLIEMSITTMMPLLMVVTGLLFTQGIILAIYIPLIPYMLFTFGIVSWLVFTIEAMAAAPIVALGLMDPKAGADEVLGRAEPAQMLLLAVFLRPSVMLVGLITGTILSYVGVNVINNTFGTIIGSLELFGSSGTFEIIKEVGALFIYTFIMMALINKCYETIYSIPDQIMQWIGAHTRASTDQQLLSEVKQGMGQVAQAGEAAAKGTGERVGGYVQAGGTGYRPQVKEKKESEVKGGK